MKVVHVAVGVVINNQDQVLITKRPEKAHQGGLWEFPGGKVEADETVAMALHREFQEEVDIVLNKTSPLLDVKHDYGDKCVLLDVHLCRDFNGQAKALEGQELRWVARSALADYDFPEANRAILKAVLALL
ncbi:MAG: 8-oxo-dGTP diphosphatase MutT [Pseudomonadota bacterium]